jgi:hypothetical protein
LDPFAFSVDFQSKLGFSENFGQQKSLDHLAIGSEDGHMRQIILCPAAQEKHSRKYDG